MNIHTIIEKRLKIDSRYFLGGGFWLLTAQGATILISMVGTIIFAHHLTTTDFGTYRYLVNLAVLFGSFTLTGVGQAIFQAAAKGDYWYYAIGNQRTAKYNLIGCGIAFIAAFYYIYQGNYLLAGGCAIIAILQPSSIYFLNALAFLQGQQKFKESTVLQTSRTLLITTISIITVLITQNVIILISVFLGSQAIAGLISWYQTKTNDNKILETNLVTRYNNIANHNSIRNLIIGTAARLDSIIVFQFLGASSLAIFTIATLLPEHIKGAFKNIPTLLIPRFSSRETETATNLSHRSIQGFLLLCILTGIIIILTPFIYHLIFPKYPEAILYTQLLALAFPASIYHIHLSWLQVKGQESSLYYINIITSFFLVTSAMIGAFWFGLLGVVFSRVATQYIVLLLSIFTTSRIAK